ncbi:molybdopterin-guanine dinucleotide biosynthesis protein MobB, partial [Rhizobium johnstonii]|uniref:molybdopterin-guanine dinucleotide biosynthesis protein MobB n=1 Tax=Rhizobium johnstonii TaxID=3019933 RepID=UPI003F9524CE
GDDGYLVGAGLAVAIAVGSDTRYAIMHELRGAPEPEFEEIIARLAPCDIVLIEGYKREPIPKIEARRLEAANRAPLAPSDPHICA